MDYSTVGYSRIAGSDAYRRTALGPPGYKTGIRRPRRGCRCMALKRSQTAPGVSIVSTP